MPKAGRERPDPAAATLIQANKIKLSERLSRLIPPGAVDNAAAWLGVHRSTLYKWRNGDQEPGAFYLAALANFLHVSIADLFADEPLPAEPTVYEVVPEVRALADMLRDSPETARLLCETLMSFAPSVASPLANPTSKTSQRIDGMSAPQKKRVATTLSMTRPDTMSAGSDNSYRHLGDRARKGKK